MPILIDGHNLIGRFPGLSLRDPDDEAGLIRLLMANAARLGRRVTVVFDPGDLFSLSATRRHGKVEVVFAAQGTSADALIVRRVRHSQDRRGWLVVTSDRALAAQVTRLGARTCSAEEFAAGLAKQPERDPESDERPLPPEEVAAWLALFQRRQGRGSSGG